jgi:hypothetical protein
VPELWRFEQHQLQISLLQNGKYQDSRVSAHFPQFDVIALVAEMIAKAQIFGRSKTLKAFRHQIQALITAFN